MNTQKFHNIIFDFGGVIINIDFQRTIDAFKKLRAGNFDQIYSKAGQSGLFDEFDRGAISAEKFIDGLIELLPEDVTRAQVIQAWNDILIDIPQRRIRLIEEIRAHYKTFLLSNTNTIHYAIYNKWLQDDFGHGDFAGLFDKVYLSFRLGMRKPEPGIFELALRENGLKKEETLFIDDSMHIITSSRALGIPSYWLQDGQDVCDLFENGKLKEDLGPLL